MRSPGASTHGRVGTAFIDHALVSDAQRIHRNLSSDAFFELACTAFSSWSDVTNWVCRLGETSIVPIFRLGLTVGFYRVFVAVRRNWVFRLGKTFILPIFRLGQAIPVLYYILSLVTGRWTFVALAWGLHLR